MCMTAGGAGPGTGFGSVTEALRAGRAVAAYLNSPAARELDGAACGEALVAIGAIQSGLAAAQNGLLRRFDADSAHDGDGYASTAAWLAYKTGLGRRDAKAAVRQMRLLSRHPLLDDAAADGGGDGLVGAGDRPAGPAGSATRRCNATPTRSCWRPPRRGRTWTGCGSSRRPPTRPGAPGIQTTTLPARASRTGSCSSTPPWTAPAASRRSSPPSARRRSPRCWRRSGKKRGPEDDRTAAQRFHDALQEGCELLIRAKMVPDRAGSDTRVDVEIPLSALRGMDGASLIEEAWLRARAGQPGYLAGKDAEVIACDALIVPVVTGSPQWGVIGAMITLVTDYHAQARAHGGQGNPAAQPAQPDWPDWPRSLPAQAQEALLHALARLAIDFVSGPGGIASALRRTLLGAQLNGKSAILDAGYSDHIPAAIRHAVIHRDKHCAWPAGCDRPAAVSDVHHIKHKKDGGPTSVKDCLLLCQYHHDICIGPPSPPGEPPQSPASHAPTTAPATGMFLTAAVGASLQAGEISVGGGRSFTASHDVDVPRHPGDFPHHQDGDQADPIG